MTDLDAIRERDAEIWAERDVPRDISVLDAMDAERDRRTLLAEVDALNEVVLALQQTVEREGAEVDRLEGALEREMDAGNSLLAESVRLFAALRDERARLVASVRGLALRTYSYGGGADYVDRAAVLAVIEGEPNAD